MNAIPSSVRIIIPAYNASGYLPRVLRDICRSADCSSLLVIDDGSEDRTALEAGTAGVRSIRHAQNRGKGAALKTGVRAALLDPGTKAIITMDADGQHDPADLPALYEAWVRTGADMVIGRRPIRGSGMPVHRRLSNMTTSFLVSSRTGVRIPDSQCGYRLLSRKLAESFLPDADGFEAETEWIIKAAIKGFVISSVPVRTVYRDEKSHMKNWATTKAFVRVLMKEYPWAD